MYRLKACCDKRLSFYSSAYAVLVILFIQLIQPAPAIASEENTGKTSSGKAPVVFEIETSKGQKAGEAIFSESSFIDVMSAKTAKTTPANRSKKLTFELRDDQGRKPSFDPITKGISATNANKRVKTRNGGRKLNHADISLEETTFLPEATPTAVPWEKGVALSADGEWLVMVWSSKTIISMHNLKNSKLYYAVDFGSVLDTEDKVVRHFQISPDNKAISMMIGGPDNGKLVVLDINTAQITEIPGSSKGIGCALYGSGHFSPDSSMLTAMYDTDYGSILEVIDWKKNKVVFQHDYGRQVTRSATFTSDNDLLVATDTKLHLITLHKKSHWNTNFPNDKKRLGVLTDEIQYVKTTPNSNLLVVSKLFQFGVFSKAKGTPVFIQNIGTIPELVTSLDDKSLYVGKADGNITQYSLEGSNADSHVVTATYASNDDRVNTLKLSHDGKTLIAGHANGVIRFWDITSGIVALEIRRKDKKAVTELIVTPDHKYLISVYPHNSVAIWRLHTNQKQLSAILSSIRNFATPCLPGVASPGDDQMSQLSHMVESSAVTAVRVDNDSK